MASASAPSSEDKAGEKKEERIENFEQLQLKDDDWATLDPSARLCPAARFVVSHFLFRFTKRVSGIAARLSRMQKMMQANEGVTAEELESLGLGVNELGKLHVRQSVLLVLMRAPELRKAVFAASVASTQGHDAAEAEEGAASSSSSSSSSSEGASGGGSKEMEDDKEC